MITKLKIALLTLLGFSTAACCCTKKATSNEDNGNNKQIEGDSVDTSILLMYGVPFPKDRITPPAEDESAENRMQEIRTLESEAQSEEPKVVGGPALFPDGREAIPVDQRRDSIKINKGPAPAPDGRLAAPLSEEEAARMVAEMEARAAEKAAQQE